MKLNITRILFSALVMMLIASTTWAQIQPDLQFFRYRDQRGINVWEVDKTDTVPFDQLKIRIGANFWQAFQSLSHENVLGSDTANGLAPIGPGFNLATANFNLDVQLEDGIRVAVESYMSSRHHPEFWVKGGYLQVDKITIFGEGAFIDFWTKHLRAKLGHMEVNYGDQHFRRSDNANDAYNPFMENYIMDAFATEIGGEFYYFTDPGLFAMFGVTTGLIKGDISDPDVTGTKKSPSILLKLGWDKQLNEDLRLRFTGSYYGNSESPRNTLYGGDRAGSHYYGVMSTPASVGSDFTNGRINPGFSYNVSAVQINAFAKWKGLEFFGTYETASGKSSSMEIDENGAATEDNRSVDQIAAELIYRFLPREQLFIGARYNTLSGQFAVNATPFGVGFNNPDQSLESTVNRLSVAAGWWPTKNILAKVEYVDQTYSGDGMMNTLFEDGKFGGILFTGAVHF